MMNYQIIQQKIAPQLNHFLKSNKLNAQFHHLELLSTSHQLVFAPDKFISPLNYHLPVGTKLVGSLSPLDAKKNENDFPPFAYAKDAIILCFGSALDPADYEILLQTIIKTAQKFSRHLIIGSRKLSPITTKTITISPYLPLHFLMKKAALLIHHGGANSFSEALTIGIPQILIPLANDQIIQGEYLTQSMAGITIDHHAVTEKTLEQAFERVFDAKNELHKHRKRAQTIFTKENGAMNAAKLIESVAKKSMA